MLQAASEVKFKPELTTRANDTKVAGYFDGLNRKLFDAIPAAAKVLELGCANGRLGELYKSMNPNTKWIGVDLFEGAVLEASKVLDLAVKRDLDSETLTDLGTDFDVVVFGDLIEHVKDPLKLIRHLRGLVKEDGMLICCIHNMAHFSVITRFISGDYSYDPNGLLDETHLRLYSPSSSIKLLLDGGWLPTLSDRYVVNGPDGLISELAKFSVRLGSSIDAAVRNLTTYQMIFHCTALPIAEIKHATVPQTLTVVVPVNSPLQFDLNVSRSPGLSEISARIVPIFNAKSPLSALNEGRKQADSRWILFCHQDMYFPSGFGFKLLNELEKVPDSKSQVTLLGLIGLVRSAASRFGNEEGISLKGQIVDRITRLNGDVDGPVETIDECAVILARDSALQIDETLGWHLWATDLVVQLAKMSGSFCDILNIACFHNSYNDGKLSNDYHSSLRTLFKKHVGRDTFNTLCGTWRYRSLSQPLPEQTLSAAKK